MSQKDEILKVKIDYNIFLIILLNLIIYFQNLKKEMKNMKILLMN